MYDENDCKISDPKKIANHINRYFSEIEEKLSQKIEKPGDKIPLPPMNVKAIFVKPTNYIEVKQVITQFKDKTGGVDNISARTIKKMSDDISEPLAYIFIYV